MMLLVELYVLFGHKVFLTNLFFAFLCIAETNSMNLQEKLSRLKNVFENIEKIPLADDILDRFRKYYIIGNLIG